MRRKDGDYYKKLRTKKQTEERQIRTIEEIENELFMTKDKFLSNFYFLWVLKGFKFKFVGNSDTEEGLIECHSITHQISPYAFVYVSGANEEGFFYRSAGTKQDGRLETDEFQSFDELFLI